MQVDELYLIDATFGGKTLRQENGLLRSIKSNDMALRSDEVGDDEREIAGAASKLEHAHSWLNPGVAEELPRDRLEGLSWEGEVARDGVVVDERIFAGSWPHSCAPFLFGQARFAGQSLSGYAPPPRLLQDVDAVPTECLLSTHSGHYELPVGTLATQCGMYVRKAYCALSASARARLRE